MSEESEYRAWVARNGAIFILGLLTGIFLFNIILPGAIAGNRVSGTTDAAVIKAYYSHGALAPLQIGVFVLAPFGLAFGYALREVLAIGRRERFLATLGMIFVCVEMPLILTMASLQATLVSVTASGGDPVPLFRFWDILYNGATYALEAGWLLAFSLAMRGVRPFPSWLTGYGLVCSSLQAFNMCSLFLGVPDSATLIGNFALVGWLAVVCWSLFRVAKNAGEATPAQGLLPAT